MIRLDAKLHKSIRLTPVFENIGEKQLTCGYVSAFQPFQLQTLVSASLAGLCRCFPLTFEGVHASALDLGLLICLHRPLIMCDECHESYMDYCILLFSRRHVFNYLLPMTARQCAFFFFRPEPYSQPCCRRAMAEFHEITNAPVSALAPRRHTNSHSEPINIDIGDVNCRTSIALGTPNTK